MKIRRNDQCLKSFLEIECVVDQVLRFPANSESSEDLLLVYEQFAL